MWWWGPCAGASCCTDVVVPRRKRAAALYDELVPLQSGRRASATTASGGDRHNNSGRVHGDDDSDADSQLLLRERASGLEIAPGIYRARDVHTHDAVALKVFDKAVLQHQATRRRLRHELDVLARLRDHPNILRLYGVYSSRRTFEIAFELARGGEVLHRIVGAGEAAQSADAAMARASYASASLGLFAGQPRYRVTEREISRVVASAASAVQFMHQLGLVHGEIRPEHLLYSDLEPDARVLVADFGRAAAWRELTFRSRIHKGRFLWDDRHSARFLPPAVLARRPRDGVPDWAHAQQVDVWSLGVTMFVLLCGAFPFDGATPHDIRARVLRDELKFPAAQAVPLSRAAKDLLLKLLEKDPARAPSIDDVCAHPWLSADVAADVRWGDAQIGAFGVFAERYARDVAASTLRQPTLEHGGSGGSSSLLPTHNDGDGDDARHQLMEPPQFDVYGVANSNSNRNSTSYRSSDADGTGMAPDFNPEDERPSFVSTDGNNHTSDGDERLSADAYMRLASAELDAVTARKAASPTRRKHCALLPAAAEEEDETTTRASATAPEDDPPPPRADVKGDFWPVFSKQRRLFSFKKLSFRSTSSGSKSD